MVFEINQIENDKLNQTYERAMRELNSFFEIDWIHNRPNLVIAPDRKTIDSLRGEKTEDWLIGWTEGTSIYILSEKNFEKESSHKYSEERYFALIKHELAHSFSGVIGNNYQKPSWLFEGISVFLSGQLSGVIKPKSLENFIGYYDSLDENGYLESGFAIKYLVEEYGKKKLLNLLKRSKDTNSKKEFEEMFCKHYCFELKYNNFKI